MGFFLTVSEWALSNNLTLNTSKTKEIVIQNAKLRQKATPPAPLPRIVRESSLRVLGVTLTPNLSASEHVRGVYQELFPDMKFIHVKIHVK